LFIPHQGTTSLVLTWRTIFVRVYNAMSTLSTLAGNRSQLLCLEASGRASSHRPMLAKAATSPHDQAGRPQRHRDAVQAISTA
jgi:hypothetical protein